MQHYAEKGNCMNHEKMVNCFFCCHKRTLFMMIWNSGMLKNHYRDKKLHKKRGFKHGKVDIYSLFLSPFQIHRVKQSSPVSTKSFLGRSYSVRSFAGSQKKKTHTHKHLSLVRLWVTVCLSVFWFKPVGQYLPSCDEEGYYRSHQCHSSSGQCWCVDRYGNEVAGSRTHGPADCGMQKLQKQNPEEYRVRFLCLQMEVKTDARFGVLVAGW